MGIGGAGVGKLGVAAWGSRNGAIPPAVEELEERLVPTLLGQQLFPLDYPWNQNISNAPVAANSVAIIAHIGASIHLHPDWGADSPANGTSPLYGIPFNVVHGNSTGKVNVVIDNYAGESDIVPAPIPANAVIEGDYQNGPNPNGAGYNTNQRGDSHLIVWDEDNNIAYELFGVSRQSDPYLFPDNNGVELQHTDSFWHAAQETVWNMSTDSFRTLGETSADAAGLSILAGLARPDEGLSVSQRGQGVITHALRMTLPAGDINPQYIYPASHMVSTSPGANNLPLGSRLRLASTPAISALISNMPPESQVIARAMQQYGLILADIGSAMYVTGASASVDATNNISLTWDVNDLFASNGLEVLTAGDFEVVNLTPVLTGLSAGNGSPGTTITITGRNFSGAAGHLSVFFGSTPSGSVQVLSDTRITAVVPNGAGTVNVTVQSGVNETDTISSSPSANVNAPTFGYGTSAISPAGQFTFGALSAQQRFVEALYTDFLHRTGDLSNPNDAGAWVTALFRGTSQATVANAIARSGEALGVDVDGLYQRFLSRAADAAGRAAFVGYLQKGGTLEGVSQIMLASQEYQSLFPTPSAFIQSLYQNLLHRTGSTAEVNAWLAILPQLGRAGVARDFLSSAEFRAWEVEDDYAHLLHRTQPPSAAELNAWVNSSFDLLTIDVLFTSSAEFWLNG
jgi:hypothetical protein